LGFFPLARAREQKFCFRTLSGATTRYIFNLHGKAS
jgi:hypothetical protein